MLESLNERTQRNEKNNRKKGKILSEIIAKLLLNWMRADQKFIEYKTFSLANR